MIANYAVLAIAAVFCGAVIVVAGQGRKGRLAIVDASVDAIGALAYARGLVPWAIVGRGWWYALVALAATGLAMAARVFPTRQLTREGQKAPVAWTATAINAAIVMTLVCIVWWPLN